MRFRWEYENPTGLDNGTWAKILDSENNDRIVATAENGIMTQAFCDVLNSVDQSRYPEGLVYVN